MRDAAGVRTIIESHELRSNYEPEKATRPNRGWAMSIIDLNITTSELEILDFSMIDKELATLTNNKLIAFDIGNLDKTVSSIRTIQDITEWAIRAMSEEEKEGAQKAW